MEKTLAYIAPLLIYFYIFVLNAFLPGRWVKGYVTRENSDEKLSYRLNGLQVLFFVLLSWVILCYFGYLEWDWLYIKRWQGLAGSAVAGMIFSLAIVIPHPPVKKSFPVDFYLGRLKNPQLLGGRIDAKMWLYLAGATMLELNVLSFTAHHYILYGNEASPGIYLAAALLTYFVIDYLTFEEVHLYTYDFVAERAGFKLGWGCIAFYPYFYAIPLWSTVSFPDPQTPSIILILYGLLFFVSWGLACGANLQKYYFRKHPDKAFLGIIPDTLKDGNKSILVNGFWGLSRHINYLGEIGMATGIVLCTGYPSMIWPWLYPLYYIALLVPRQIADDKRCGQKYGPLWEQYKQKVPYRIIPFIY